MRIARSLLGDIVLAAVITLGGIIGTRFAGTVGRADVPIDARGLVLFAATALVLAVRRRWPLAVLAAVTVCTTVYLILGYAYGPILGTFMIAVYTAARHAVVARAVPCAVAALVLLLPHLLIRDDGLGWSGAIPVSAWVVVPFAVGYSLRVRHDAAVRARAEAIRQSVDEERFHVAQEVHDIVGHGLAAIKMQADVALHVLAKKPDQAEAALEAISRTSSEALDELRATLTVIRRTDCAPEPAPAPSLARLEELRQRMAAAGVDVSLDVSGHVEAPLPVGVELTGYRIVQEALTNVLRHSGAREATVGIRHEAGSVLITVANPLTGPVCGQGGTGIAGMRERALGLGGELTAGPVSQDAFEVRARLPTGDSS